MAVKRTPRMMVIWVANIILKGIAELADYQIDLDARKVYAKTTLYGENEAIEVWFDGFAIAQDGEAYTFMLHEARSNKPWLGNIFSHIVGKAWKIPVPPKLRTQFQLIADLLKAENAEQKVLEADTDLAKKAA
jgi:hypothetical protein